MQNIKIQALKIPTHLCRIYFLVCPNYIPKCSKHPRKLSYRKVTQNVYNLFPLNQRHFYSKTQHCFLPQVQTWFHKWDCIELP